MEGVEAVVLEHVWLSGIVEDVEKCELCDGSLIEDCSCRHKMPACRLGWMGCSRRGIQNSKQVKNVLMAVWMCGRITCEFSAMHHRANSYAIVSLFMMHFEAPADQDHRGSAEAFD